MNAIDILLQDHQNVAELFEQAEAEKDQRKKQRLFEQIRLELEMHTQLEETLFYPEIKKHENLKDLVLEAVEEHKQVKTLLREMSSMQEVNEKFDAKLKVMRENVEHHVEEEESEIFPKVEEHYDEDQLERMGQAMEAAKRQLQRAA